MDPLRIHILGRLQLLRGLEHLDRFPTVKAQLLFCYLVLFRHRSHSRETLSGLFWGDTPENQARKSLRTTLWRLRSILEPSGVRRGVYLCIEGDDVWFNTRSDHWLDAQEFEDCLAAVQETRSTADGDSDSKVISALTHAVNLYRGDLLEGCYEDWCLYERERLRQVFLTALNALMICHRDRREYDEATHYGQRILSYDPLLESVHRELMRLHCLAGNRAAALRQYEQCQSVLVKEMGIDPMPETTQLWREIRQDLEIVAGATRDGALTALLQPAYLTSEIDQTLSELQGVQTAYEELHIRFQKGVDALRTIRRELGPEIGSR